MRKLVSSILVLCMIFALAACTAAPNETTATSPDENVDKYTLVFTNDGMSLDLNWEILNKAIKGQHKNAEMMREAIAKNKEYYANLIKVKIAVYNYDNTKDTGIQTTLTPNISLLEDTDITVSTKRPEAGAITYIGDKYPAERMHQMLRLGFKNYGIQITGIYKIGYGDDISSEYTFKLKGTVEFEDKTDATKLHTGNLTLLDDGAEIKIKYTDILDEFGLTLDDIKTGSNERISTLGLIMYSSKREFQTGSMKIMHNEFTADTRPEWVVFSAKYDRAWSNNQALIDEYNQVGQEMYAELELTLYVNDTEYNGTYFIRCDVQDNRTK